MENQKPEQIPMPKIIVVKALELASRGLHFVGDSIRHETPSEHFVTDPLLTTPDHVGFIAPPEV